MNPDALFYPAVLLAAIVTPVAIIAFAWFKIARVRANRPESLSADVTAERQITGRPLCRNQYKSSVGSVTTEFI